MRPILILILFLTIASCRQTQKEIDNEKYQKGLTKAMDEFRKDLDNNRILTKQILDTTADKKLEDKIIANINSKLDDDLGNDKEILPKLSKERQAIYIVYLLEMEVNNGGFDQYYQNQVVNDDNQYKLNKTPWALEQIGATKFADLARRANNIFKVINKDTTNRDSRFDKFDEEFYDTYTRENIDSLRVKFIRNNISAFIDK